MLIKYIEYEGKKYPVRVGYYALRMFQEETGKTISELKQEDLKDYETLLFYSMKQGHKKRGLEFTFKQEDMIDVLDECFFQFVEMIPLFFPSGTQQEAKNLGKQKNPTKTNKGSQKKS
jgi:hypothetical protein